MSRLFSHILNLFLIEALLFVLGTEILSIFNLLNFSGLLLFWIISLSLLFAFFHKALFDFELNISFKEIFRNLDLVEKVMTLIILSILGITFITAIYYPPNNWDSMTYHMARVVNWIQLESVNHYPTGIERQNFSMPFAEYVICQLQLLTGSDHLANLVQWYCFLLSIITGYMISLELKLSRKFSLLAALLTASLPMAIMQASSTQNDVVAGLFVLLFAYFLMRNLKEYTLSNVLLAGASLGLAILSKGSSYLYCFALFLAFFLLKFKGNRIHLLKYASLILALALAINSGFYIRNYSTYGNILSSGNEKVMNEKKGLSILLSNLIRNSTLHLAVPNEGINHSMQEMVQKVLGPESDNAASTFEYTNYQVKYRLHEDEKGNFWQFIFLSFSVLIFAFLPRKNSTSYLLFLSVVLCVFLYCFLLKWQPWGSRIQSSIFFMAAPLIAFVLSRLNPTKMMVWMSVVLISAASIPSLLFNESRPTLDVFKNTDRSENYFRNKPFLYEEFKDLVSIAGKNGHRVIGLELKDNTWEYPLWVMLEKEGKSSPPFIYHIVDGNYMAYDVVISNLDAEEKENYAVALTTASGFKCYVRK